MNSPAFWVTEMVKYLSSWGFSSPCPELAQLLVTHLCFDNNHPSLWKFLENALSSGLLFPLQLLSLLASRVIPHRQSQPQAYRLFLELLTRYALTFDPTGLVSCKQKIINSIDIALQLSQTYNICVLELGHALVLFFHSIIISLIDSTLEDWTLHLTSHERPSLAVGSTDDYSVLLLRSVHLNMPEKFDLLLQKLQFLESHELASSESKSASEVLAKLCANIQKVLCFEYHLSKHQFLGMLVDIGSHKPVLRYNFESGQLARTFLALWLSALRLVQRESDPPEGPIPHLEARLCVLLSVVPLAITNVLEDESKCLSASLQGYIMYGYINTGTGYGHSIAGKGHGLRKYGLFSSLQSLGQFSALLCPPASVVGAANSAATKPATFISKSKNEKDGSGTDTQSNASIKTKGNMWHLIVEACIARNLLDTSAYYWPGFVSKSVITLSDLSPVQKSPWSTFMEGTPYLAEINKLYYVALKGSEEERPAAAKILCGATLSHGWNIQEHVVHYVVKLLSPPVPPNHTGSPSHLVNNIGMLSAILYGASSIDTVHILSLHGVVPEVAASLMPLCEAFGMLKPTFNNKLSTGDDPSVYMVFSLAFLFLIRLWKFYRLPLEQCITERGVSVGGELTLEYLLLLRNSHLASHQDELKSNPNLFESASDKPVFLDSFPQLRAWYCQNKSCIASTLSGLSTGNPVHHVANKILSMIYWKITKTEASDLTTGLRDLVDFLPASLAAIISYFSAEVTRGIWKSVAMNGVDWPSPAAILQTVELEMKDILAAVGVHIPSCSSAALVSLTITFKLDKSLEYIHAVAGPALENCASGCPWPSMPIIGSLWAQKVPRWHDFIVVSCSLSVFRQNKEAIAQLLRSCFSSFLGTPCLLTSKLTNESSISGLLGSTISAGGVHHSVAPGFLYLRSCQSIHNINTMSASSWQSGVQLVPELYRETIPIWLLSSDDEKLDTGGAAPRILEGYAIAYLLILSGSIIWGVGAKLPSWTFSRRSRIIGVHMDFLAGVMDGQISLGCDPATWKAYVSCFVALLGVLLHLGFKK
ncbi:Mediator of RNA polymerase II transcription subunit 33A-like [Quillaja saponaria]|uniref:Mediator of RNA polymerase II transcription subunit 33A-like n=1 Tax=Quillaja saponaria TaxID=32244 RepID=A0AAD7LMV9_QUISA|nr:Mediator of RNA polymerase II transcription subunit 33A-like [Quillaja saponaria]